MNDQINIDDFKKENGFYDIRGIMNAVGAEKHSLFSALFADPSDPDQPIEDAQHPLVAEAIRRNEEMYEAEASEIKAEDVAKEILDGKPADVRWTDYESQMKRKVDMMHDSEYRNLVDLLDEAFNRITAKMNADPTANVGTLNNRILFAYERYNLKATCPGAEEGVLIIEGNTTRYTGEKSPLFATENEEFLASLGL
jgi:hypothetical protein